MWSRFGILRAVSYTHLQITDLKISLSSKTAEKTAHENRARELLEQALARGQEEEEQAARQQELQRQAEACDRAIASCGNILAGYRKKLDKMCIRDSL